MSDARWALAKVLTSTISKGTLVRRLRRFPRFYSGSSSVSVTQRSPENRVFRAELESVLQSKFQTELDWEDPVRRTGLTTFKVVPSKSSSSVDPGITSASPETRKERAESEVDPGSPDRSDTLTPPPPPGPGPEEMEAPHRPVSPPQESDCQGGPGSSGSDGGHTDEEGEEGEPEVTQAAPLDCDDEELTADGQTDSGDQSRLLQSPGDQSVNHDSGQCDPSAEEEDEEVVLQEDDSFPLPPPPVFYNGGTDILEEVKEDTSTSTPGYQATSGTSSGPTSTVTEDLQDDETSSVPEKVSAAPAPLEKIKAAPSRFAQAVALAVQRSRLQTHVRCSSPEGPGCPNGTRPSTPRSSYQYGELGPSSYTQTTSTRSGETPSQHAGESSHGNKRGQVDVRSTWLKDQFHW